jgi:ribosomal protein S12 methylthiotransferase accessory factor YcaO
LSALFTARKKPGGLKTPQIVSVRHRGIPEFLNLSAGTRIALSGPSYRPGLRMSAASARVTCIANAIERYVSEHPRATDSIEGIRTWWITHERRNDSPAEVQSAVDHLVASGRLSRITLPDGTIVYTRSPPGT